MKIALVQMDVAHGQPVENKKHVKEMLERALVANPDVIVLPEMWNTGYALDELDGLLQIRKVWNLKNSCLSLPENMLLLFLEGLLLLRETENSTIRLMFTTSLGNLINIYSKVHLFGLMAEDRYMSAGDAESILSLMV